MRTMEFSPILLSWNKSNTIESNNIKNTRIIIVTDDDNYDIWTTENTNRNFSTLSSNHISVISLWSKVKKYKSEFNNLLAATNWNIYTSKITDDIIPIVDKIFNIQNGNNIQIQSCEKEIPTSLSDKILAGYISSQLLSQISNHYSWEKIAEIQTNIAKKYGIVNQFNSYIALETEQQKRDLENYENNPNKYKADYTNEWSSNSKISNKPFFDSMDFDDFWVRNNSSSLWVDPNNHNAGNSFSYVGRSSSLSWTGIISIIIWLIVFWVPIWALYIMQFYSIIIFIKTYRKKGHNEDEEWFIMPDEQYKNEIEEWVTINKQE